MAEHTLNGIIEYLKPIVKNDQTLYNNALDTIIRGKLREEVKAEWRDILINYPGILLQVVMLCEAQIPPNIYNQMIAYIQNCMREG